MLKTIFLGFHTEFNQLLVHWLAQRTDLRGVVWSRNAWRKSLRGHLRFARQRMSRGGLLKTIDEGLFYGYYRGRLAVPEYRAVIDGIVRPYEQTHGRIDWRGDQIQGIDVNAPEVVAFVREREPDVALATCISCHFGKVIRSIPRHGVFLWHEGITPEYRGLYSPFWALSNLDFDNIGYTLLQMNSVHDAGDIYVQGKAIGVDPFRQLPGFLGHKAIYDSLPEVERFLQELEAGRAQPLQRTDARARDYTYPGMSDFLRQRLRLRRLQRRLATAASSR